MCGNGQHLHLDGLGHGDDEFILDTPAVRSFVGAVRRAAAGAAGGPAGAIEAIKPHFSRLLADDTWLPARYQADAPNSGMGGGIGQWLLFRSGRRDLCLFALVIPAGAQTPVHDHLAWGLIGLYRGNQEEVVYARRDDAAPVGEREALDVKLRRPVSPGEFYPLLPPRDDIHRVRTTSPTTSVSIHLLANDTGCVWRHTFDPDTAEVRPFRSGYVNRPCDDAAAD